MVEMMVVNQSDLIRTFICIEIPDAVKAGIAAVQKELKGIDAEVSWVKPDNVHLTLKFLGDVARTRIGEVRQAVERAARVTGPFEFSASGTGCFPSPRSPRVLWVGLAAVPEELRRLHAALEDELARVRFKRETKRFAPHLTIGRVRSPRNAGLVGERLLDVGFEAVTVPAQEVVIMRSELKPTGSIYTPQAAIPLAAIPD
jgi:2'-5' RNA ligase